MISSGRPAASTSALEERAQLPATRVVGVRLVVLRVQQHAAGRRDRRHDVDVPVRAEVVVVAGQAARQPDRVVAADRAGQLGLDAALVGVRVAARVELHRLGEQHRALAVDVDAAALVDELRADRARRRRARRRSAPMLGRELPLRPGRGAPAVEDPVHRAEHAGTLVVDDERRTEVTHPELVERRLDDLDRRPTSIRRARGDLGGIDDHRDRLELGDGVRGRGPRRVALLALRRRVAERLPGAGERHPGPLVGRRLRGHPPGHPWHLPLAS